jgi:hypothetical protein
VTRPVALTCVYDDVFTGQRHPATAVLAMTQIAADDELAKIMSLAVGTGQDARLLAAPRRATRHEGDPIRSHGLHQHRAELCRSAGPSSTSAPRLSALAAGSWP